MLALGPEPGIETAEEMAQALAAGRVRCAELVERAVRRAEAWQAATRAFSQLWPEEALTQARRIDAGAGRPGGPLHGIPVAVKDLFDVAGKETTGCCAAYAGTIPSVDAPTIARLRAADAVIIGKTNQHEIAAGATNLISACGRTGNPWNPARMTGGSSGGSGAAVAARVVPVAVGSDTGGSVRIPSAMCGTFGLKPTTGAIPIDGMLPHSPSLDCPGPLAATARDTALVHAVLSGRQPPTPCGAERERLFRIAVPADGYFRDHVESECLVVLEGTVRTFGDAGCQIEEVDGTGIEDARRVWARVAYPELYRAHLVLQDRRDRVHPAILSLLDFGREVPEDDREAAARRREEIARWFEERIGPRDALLIPTTPAPAELAAENVGSAGTSAPGYADRIGPAWLACSVNLAGLPAINLPAGWTARGLPIGVSLVGHHGREDVILLMAARWETATGYQPRTPPIPSGPFAVWGDSV